MAWSRATCASTCCSTKDGQWRELVSGSGRRQRPGCGHRRRGRAHGARPYELRLHVADYYRARGTHCPSRPFMDVQVFRFAVADTARHYHLPVKLTPWGMSCFRGA
ncbi:MAG: hydroxyisourate hydrolase [Pseudorhodoferax sp.]